MITAKENSPQLTPEEYFINDLIGGFCDCDRLFYGERQPEFENCKIREQSQAKIAVKSVCLSNLTFVLSLESTVFPRDYER